MTKLKGITSVHRRSTRRSTRGGAITNQVAARPGQHGVQSGRRGTQPHNLPRRSADLPPPPDKGRRRHQDPKTRRATNDELFPPPQPPLPRLPHQPPSLPRPTPSFRHRTARGRKSGSLSECIMYLVTMRSDFTAERTLASRYMASSLRDTKRTGISSPDVVHQGQLSLDSPIRRRN